MFYRFVSVDTESGRDLRRWVLTPPVIVGRCPTSNIMLRDASISRRHCQFYHDPFGSLVVRDLGSKNGIFVDERRVDKAIVRPGSQIRIGLVTLRTEWTEEEEQDVQDQDVGEVFDLGETQPVQIVRAEDQAEPPPDDVA